MPAECYTLARSPFRIELVQLHVGESKTENLKNVINTLNSKQHSDLVVFPEYCMGCPNGTLTRNYLVDISEPLNGNFVEEVRKKSAEKDTAVILPIHEKEHDAIYNTSVIIDRGKILGGYRKVHLFDALGYRESDTFRAGSSSTLFTLGGINFGIVTCYDLRFPELMKNQVLAGATVILVPAAWYRGPLKEEQWQTLLMARAQENTSFVIGVGNANEAFIGRSMVISPVGVKVLDLGSDNRVGYFDLDVEEIAEARRKFPMIEQSRKLPNIPCLTLN
ncbi:MAG TPA: carbon-nitrogen hydrolase family protein [Candidatus Acidoferrales bacterium]|nr:carbon-nitrogen hydrolase family protein [Candidatus Acidoferrales bacterium]